MHENLIFFSVLVVHECEWIFNDDYIYCYANVIESASLRLSHHLFRLIYN